MKTLAFLSAACLFAGAVAAPAQTPPPPPPAAAKSQAPAYVAAAGQSDLFEINSSRIAVRKAQNPAVRQFAQMLIDHHQKTTAATLAAARAAKVKTPPPPRLEAGATASIRELERASGADFDRIYLGQQVPAHRAALDLHTAYSQGGDKAELKASAASAVPIVQQHLDQAQRLASGGGA
ncbi:hypothetical protein COC42_11710 [Sphingomonas spermidinifaciens]|uniref:DUF4142 domain-containing protein n=1 Tax=Sphingomonas spermidinifaciens TaxID=1141889 RepID=A0A2A4AYW4_9SPHN|nr:DUF4142 domain-containing protein [Sphingomonas spermidinifaciens]PCD02133.1 hypothetical protein COC42_11710 [Sphingomonas spermidinifaciens]